jgi:hypothetical protein
MSSICKSENILPLAKKIRTRNLLQLDIVPSLCMIQYLIPMLAPFAVPEVNGHNSIINTNKATNKVSNILF